MQPVIWILCKFRDIETENVIVQVWFNIVYIWYFRFFSFFDNLFLFQVALQFELIALDIMYFYTPWLKRCLFWFVSKVMLVHCHECICFELLLDFLLLNFEIVETREWDCCWEKISWSHTVLRANILKTSLSCWCCLLNRSTYLVLFWYILICSEMKWWW